MFLVVVFGGEDVVICVANVVFWQSLFVVQKIRHCFVKYFDGRHGLGEWFGADMHLSFLCLTVSANPNARRRTRTRSARPVGGRLSGARSGSGIGM